MEKAEVNGGAGGGARLQLLGPAPEAMTRCSTLHLSSNQMLNLLYIDFQHTIGRAKENRSIIPHVAISRSHCILSRSPDDKWKLKDLSTYGIQINDVTIDKHVDYELNNGDIIKLDSTGIFVYVFKREPLQNKSENSVNKRKNSSSREENKNLKDKKVKLSNDDIVNERLVRPCVKISRAERNAVNKREISKEKLEKEKLEKRLKAKEQETKKVKQEMKNLKEELKKKELVMQQLKSENSEIKSLKNKDIQNPDPLSPNEVFKDVFEEDLQCSICMEMFINPLILNCGHTLCEYCVDNCKKKSNLCPLCRRTIKGEHPNITLHSLIETVSAKLEFSPKSRRAEIIEKRELAKKKCPNRTRRYRFIHT